LPQGSRTLTNGAGAPYNLVSILGTADLRTLIPVQVWDNILLADQQGAPVLLRASNFNLDVMNTDSTDISVKIDRNILKLAWHQICTLVFAKICTGYINQPQAALNHIK
jgi:hypothetical protein